MIAADVPGCRDAICVGSATWVIGRVPGAGAELVPVASAPVDVNAAPLVTAEPTTNPPVRRSSRREYWDISAGPPSRESETLCLKL
jgi:hypothetical protein